MTTAKEKLELLERLRTSLPKPFTELSEDEQNAFVRKHYMELLRAKTSPIDPRFAATTDQSKACWINYNESLKCLHTKGNKNKECIMKYIHANDRCGAYKIDMYQEAQRNGQWWGYPWPTGPNIKKLPWETDDDHHGHH